MILDRMDQKLQRFIDRWGGVIIMLLFIAIAAYLGYLYMRWQFNLCIDEGLSFWYCVKHVM